MATRKHAGGDAEIGQASTDLAPAATQSAEAWLDSHAELLHEVDAMTQAWVQRRRETIDAVRHSMEEMRKSRELADLLRIQQEWVSGSLRRVASDLEALTALAGTMWRRTMLRFTESGQRTATKMQSASEPILSGSGEAPMLSTAGSKPRGRARGRPRKPQEADTVDWADAVR